jgi:hypothetical protein
MYKNFTITESEREQILNMHKDKGYKKPLNESNELSEGDDEDYFARHGEKNVWTGSSNKTYKELPDFDFDDETYDDFDSLHTTYPNFHSHYSGSGNTEHAKSMFNTYKNMEGPLQIKKRRRVDNQLNESASAMAADAIAKAKSGQGNSSIAGEITNCITSNGYTHLAILTTGAGATALGALAALFASGAGTIPALIIAAAGAIMVTIEGFLTSSGSGSASVTSELTDLHSCLKSKKVI